VTLSQHKLRLETQLSIYFGAEAKASSSVATQSQMDAFVSETIIGVVVFEHFSTTHSVPGSIS
jgi:hypothetical protein